MKVLNLQCAHQHAFEGWFGSEEDFLRQLSQGLVECPMCASKQVVKMLSAPRLNLGAAKPSGKEVALPDTPSAPLPDMQLAWLKLVQHVMANTDDVGDRFVDEARKIHYGETPERAIRGQASPQEAEALLDEGIAVVSLPVPAALKGPLQ